MSQNFVLAGAAAGCVQLSVCENADWQRLQPPLPAPQLRDDWHDGGDGEDGKVGGGDDGDKHDAGEDCSRAEAVAEEAREIVRPLRQQPWPRHNAESHDIVVRKGLHWRLRD